MKKSRINLYRLFIERNGGETFEVFINKQCIRYRYGQGKYTRINGIGLKDNTTKIEDTIINKLGEQIYIWTY